MFQACVEEVYWKNLTKNVDYGVPFNGCHHHQAVKRKEEDLINSGSFMYSNILNTNFALK